MLTIAIVNEKGGTGKTTTSVNLAAALGQAGKRVLLVDLDGQAASSRWLGVEDDTRFADALWRGNGLEPLPEVMPNVSLAPGCGKLDAVAHDLRPTQGGQLRKLLAEQPGFDYVLIDCPPSLGNRLIGNALMAASHVIVPVETSILALDGLKILLTTLQDVRDGLGHDVALAGVLACRFDSRTRLSHLVLEELRRALPGKVFQTVIRENVRMRECPAAGKSIMDYAGDSHAAADYRALAGELIAMDLQTAAKGQMQFEQTAAGLKEHFKRIAPQLFKARRREDSLVAGARAIEQAQKSLEALQDAPDAPAAAAPAGEQPPERDWQLTLAEASSGVADEESRKMQNAWAEESAEPVVVKLPQPEDVHPALADLLQQPAPAEGAAPAGPAASGDEYPHLRALLKQLDHRQAASRAEAQKPGWRKLLNKVAVG